MHLVAWALSGVAEVRQGKQFVLTIDGEVDDAKLAQINEIASLC